MNPPRRHTTDTGVNGDVAWLSTCDPVVQDTQDLLKPSSDTAYEPWCAGNKTTTTSWTDDVFSWYIFVWDASGHISIHAIKDTWSNAAQTTSASGRSECALVGRYYSCLAFSPLVHLGMWGNVIITEEPPGSHQVSHVYGQCARMHYAVFFPSINPPLEMTTGNTVWSVSIPCR